jgi:hypothetical protein
MWKLRFNRVPTIALKQTFSNHLRSPRLQQQYRSLHFVVTQDQHQCHPLSRYNSIGSATTRYNLQHHKQLKRQQLVQYRTRMKLIDFDQFTPEAMAAKEEKIKSEYVVGHRKKTMREKREQDRERRIAEENLKYVFRYDIWEEMIQKLLDVETYPVGFTNTYERSVIASWCQQMSHTLQQTLSLNASTSLESVLQLLDRLFQEHEAHIPSSGGVQVLMSPDVSSSAIESALKSWKFSLSYPPYYELMTVEHVHRAQERIQYYGNFLAKHDESMIHQISELLDVDRIVHTKTQSTDRLLWGHIPHTKHPNATDTNATFYLNHMENNNMEVDVDGMYFSKNDSDEDDY